MILLLLIKNSIYAQSKYNLELRNNSAIFDAGLSNGIYFLH